MCDDLTKIWEIFASKFESVYTLDDTSNLAQLSSLNFSEHLTNVTFEENTVKHHLLILNSSSASGIDGISPFLWKRSAHSLAFPRTMMMQNSFQTHAPPEIWLKVVPIFNKRNELDPNNYRPISLLSVVSKIMEHIIDKQLTPFRLRNNIIPPNQHGFPPGRSISANLLP